MRGWALTVAVAALAAGGSASAEIKERRRDVFTLVYEAPVSASPEAIHARVFAPGEWWADAATLGGKGAGMRLDARSGGCLCEAMPAGPYVHGIVDDATRRDVRVYALLGPVVDAADEAWLHISWPQTRDGGRTVRMTYQVRGPHVGRLAEDADAFLAPSFRRLAESLAAP